MPILEHDGVFTMVVPDGWKATRSGRTYEVLPPSGGGSIHISVYERKDAPVTESEISGFVSKFLEAIQPLDPVEIKVLAESPDQHRAVARCTGIEPESGDPYEWLVFAVLWRRTMLMCSANGLLGSGWADEAEPILAGIAPTPKRRRLLRKS